MAEKPSVARADDSGVKGGDLATKTQPTKKSYKTNALSNSKTGKEEEEITAESLQRAAKERTYTARATIIGNPNIKAGMLIEINNVGKKFGGKWWVKTVRHKITTGGYLTDLELQRDALGSNDGNKKGRDSGVVKSSSSSTKKNSNSTTTNSTVNSKTTNSSKSSSGKKLKVDAETGSYYWVDGNGNRI